ncbi:hypothetical protein ACHAXM_011830 [Skeletonema potamos]
MSSIASKNKTSNNLLPAICWTCCTNRYCPTIRLTPVSNFVKRQFLFGCMDKCNKKDSKATGAATLPTRN